MRTILLASTLLALSTPAYAIQDVFTWSPCAIEGSCKIVQDYLVGYESIDTDNATGDHKFPPIVVDPSNAHVVGQVENPGDPLSLGIVYSSVPADVIIATPVTVTESGDSHTFNIVLDIVAIAADALARRYHLPFAGDVGSALTIMQLIKDGYAPAADATYAGVQNMVQGIINAGVTQMNSGGVPIGPDPLFDFSFAIENTTFSGSFDGFGDARDPTGIHNLNLFVDGISANPSPASAIPEPSTWALMLIGFAGLAFAARRLPKRLAA
jgi:hypothetical protein